MVVAIVTLTPLETRRLANWTIGLRWPWTG